jgi:hypothetical protein
MRKGQAISSDFVFSLIIFTAASILAFTMATNTLVNREHEEVVMQAETAGALLSTEGYPEHWTSDDVLRAGLRSGDQFSLRKAGELQGLSPSDLKQALRITDEVYVYVTDGTNDTQSVFGSCGIGNLTVNETPRNVTLPAVAIISGPHPISDMTNATQRADDALYSNISAQDVIIIEGNITSNLSRSQVQAALEEASRRGTQIIIIGNPGIPAFGVDVNESTVSDLQIINDGFGFTAGETITVSGILPTLNVPGNPRVTKFMPLTNGTNAAYATWLYDDARVWYFASAAGTRSGVSVQDIIGEGARSAVTIERPLCGNITLPEAEQIAVHTRTLAYHDELLQINVIVWRDG